MVTQKPCIFSIVAYLGDVNKKKNTKEIEIRYELFLVIAMYCHASSRQFTEVGFTRFFSSGLITVIVVNPLDRKLAKRTSAQFNELLNLPNC